MNFCPQCGTKFEPDARFCQECGFDINSVIAIDELIPKSIIQPPVVETSALPPAENDIPPAATGPVIFSKKEITQPAKPSKPPKQLGRKKLWYWFVLVIVVLSAAGWLGYNMYFSSKNGKPFTIGSNIYTSENASNEQPESNTKPMSLMDQELARQKAKGQSQSQQKEGSNQDANESVKSSENDIVSIVILEVGHKEDPKSKKPKNPAKLTLQKPTMITRITTDHYNDGMGTPRGGTITIKDSNDDVVGSYKASGKTGKNGTPSARWVAEPNIMLKEGTYFISDSDPATWSKTFLGGNGFIVVEGYEIE